MYELNRRADRSVAVLRHGWARDGDIPGHLRGGLDRVAPNVNVCRAGYRGLLLLQCRMHTIPRRPGSGEAAEAQSWDWIGCGLTSTGSEFQNCRSDRSVQLVQMVQTYECYGGSWLVGSVTRALKQFPVEAFAAGCQAVVSVRNFLSKTMRPRGYDGVWVDTGGDVKTSE